MGIPGLGYQRPAGCSGGLSIMEYSRAGDYPVRLECNDSHRKHESGVGLLRDPLYADVPVRDDTSLALVPRVSSSLLSPGDPCAGGMRGKPVDWITAREGPAVIQHLTRACDGCHCTLDAQDSL